MDIWGTEEEIISKANALEEEGKKVVFKSSTHIRVEEEKVDRGDRGNVIPGWV